MIDWLTLEVPFPHDPFPCSKVMSFDASGAVEWMTPKSVPVVGSYDSRLFIKSIGGDGQGRATHLRVDGNFAKFLQGHNIFGINDPLFLAREVIYHLTNHLDFEYTVFLDKAISDSKVTRIDITENYSLRTRHDVLAWLRAAEFKARTRAGRPVSKGSTIYFQKTSRRWSLKFYSKGDEIERHKFPRHFDTSQSEFLKSHANNLLRCELTLRSMQLKELGLSRLGDLTQDKCQELFFSYQEKIDMNAQVELAQEFEMNLPRTVTSTYMHWKKGVDLRSVLPKPTFYRHRKILLEHNIDIAIAPDFESKSSNVIPLMRVLEARPVAIPQQAYDLNLVHFRG